MSLQEDWQKFHLIPIQRKRFYLNEMKKSNVLESFIKPGLECLVSYSILLHLAFNYQASKLCDSAGKFTIGTKFGSDDLT